MADFTEAFKRGQQAADEARNSRAEISEVFSDLNGQIAELADGKIELSRERFERKPDNPLMNFTLFAPKEYYMAITARNPRAREGSTKQLAIWESDRAGYPCKVMWGGVSRTCHDRESLEGTLAELLADPIVGETIRGLMSLPLDEDPPPGQEDS